MSGMITARRSINALLMMSAYLVIQTFVVIAHEHVHSTTAWLLGYTATPFTVVWGNPITIRGWDEGVPYDALFPSPGNAAESAIGGMPLLMHMIFVVTGLYFLRKPVSPRHSPLFFLLYWFVIVNLAELISYFIMRPFIPTGDTGRFNSGLDISPWFLFISGTLFLTYALWVLSRKVTARLSLYTDASRLEHWAIISSTAFVMFLWASGLRMMSLYPDPQWKTGLVGVAGFSGWLLAHRYRAPVIQ